MVLSASSRVMVAQLPPANIGEITELNGTARVVRDDTYAAELALDINQYDNIETAKGRLGITFLDDSQVRLTENSKLVIDEYIYNGNPDASKLSINFTSGTARFISGQLGRINRENVSISTPTANIAIRGTDFTTTVDEFGRSLIILLPDENGISSGEIEVTTAMGSVTLNQPYQATMTSVFESSPSNPVILDLTLDLIDNMLIVQPPRENKELTADESSQATNILDVDLLEFTDLETDYLEVEVEFTELDIDYLATNFFEDLLQVIEDVDKLNEGQEDQSDQVVRVTGTQIGQDIQTQIITLVQGNVISIRRNVESSAQLDLNSSQSYSISIMQDGVSNAIKVNGGSDSTIVIAQGT